MPSSLLLLAQQHLKPDTHFLPPSVLQWMKTEAALLSAQELPSFVLKRRLQTLLEWRDFRFFSALLCLLHAVDAQYLILHYIPSLHSAQYFYYVAGKAHAWELPVSMPTLPLNLLTLLHKHGGHLSQGNQEVLQSYWTARLGYKDLWLPSGVQDVQIAHTPKEKYSTLNIRLMSKNSIKEPLLSHHVWLQYYLEDQAFVYWQQALDRLNTRL